MKNGGCIIGLFHGMFEKNMLTFNPDWDQDTKKLVPFTDVCGLQHRLKDQSVTLTQEADENTSGPVYFSLSGPDGNSILVDQHV